MKHPEVGNEIEISTSVLADGVVTHAWKRGRISWADDHRLAVIFNDGSALVIDKRQKPKKYRLVTVGRPLPDGGAVRLFGPPLS